MTLNVITTDPLVVRYTCNGLDCDASVDQERTSLLPDGWAERDWYHLCQACAPHEKASRRRRALFIEDDKFQRRVIRERVELAAGIFVVFGCSAAVVAGAVVAVWKVLHG